MSFILNISGEFERRAKPKNVLPLAEDYKAVFIGMPDVASMVLMSQGSLVPDPAANGYSNGLAIKFDVHCVPINAWWIFKRIDGKYRYWDWERNLSEKYIFRD